VDAQLTPPPITEDDAKKGILSLIERGLIPPAAELSLSPSPVRNRQAMIHSPTAQHTRHCISDGTAVGANLTGVKMDPERASSPSKTPENQLRFRQRAETPSARERFIPGQTLSASSTAALTNRSSRLLTPVTFETPLLQPQPPHPTPASNLSGAQKIIIQHGVTVISSPEYKAFKLANALQWGSIVMILRQMEELLKAYCIPLAFVDGDKLVDLSIEYELEQKPSKEELLNCMINHKEIRRLTNTPGRRFKGQDGHHIAATVIQAQYRMFWERAKYLAYRKQKWAAGVIALNWLMQLRKRILRSQMKARRAAQLERFRRRATELRHNWSDVCKSRRVIVHIPSRGHSENVRDQLKHFNLMENLQIGRLCDIRDPLVDVIYVSPVELNDEMLQYYEKLMRMCEESSENKKEDTLQQQEAKRQPIEERFHFVVPEHLRSFEGHNMSLATLLMYSPLAIQRIKNLVAGRPGFIVPGLQSKHDDLAVADMLNLPCLSAEPDIAGPYSMKSGARRIFVSSQVEMPPCEFDIYSKQQFLSSLTKLVTNNLEIKRWLFKIDEEFDSRGIAFCDITDHLQCYNWALKESQRYGEKWNKKWAQEQALHRIAAELPKILEDHTVIVNKRVYPDWTSFFQVFKQGGVIEAAPPCQTSHVTSVTVNMMIDPTGEIKLVSTGDQIHDSLYHCYGVSVPQSSVDPVQLQAASIAVAKAARSRGVLGYISVDFVTFIQSQTMSQQLWAVDLDIGYSDSLAMSQLFSHVTDGQFDFSGGLFEIPLAKKMKAYEELEEKRRRDHREWEGKLIPMKPPSPVRFAVLSCRLVHTNLSIIHYNVFFRMCKAHSIGFDMQVSQRQTDRQTLNE
jgi:hypothetical protein